MTVFLIFSGLFNTIVFKNNCGFAYSTHPRTHFTIATLFNAQILFPRLFTSLDPASSAMLLDQHKSLLSSGPIVHL